MSDQKKVYEPIVFDDPKLRLYGFPVAPNAKAPSFKWRLIENNPTIEIDYGTQNDKGQRVNHQTPMDPIEINRISEIIKIVAVSKVPVSYAFDNWGHPFIWDRDLKRSVRSKEKMNLSQVEIGKKETGEVYIKYMSYKKPDAEFVFGDGQWHQIQQNGTPAPVGVVSRVSAMAWANALTSIYNTYYATNWTEPEWRRKFRLERQAQFAGGGQGGGNRNYGGNQNNNQGGGYNQQNQQPQQQNNNYNQSIDNSFDDDISFD